jgi:hypothetical protein
MRGKTWILSAFVVVATGCGGGGGGGGGSGVSYPASLDAIFQRYSVRDALRRQMNSVRFTAEYATGQPTPWSSSTLGVPDKVPNARTDIAFIGAAYAYLDAAALAQFALQFPTGAGPNAFRVDATASPVLNPGLYVFYAMALAGTFPLNEVARHFQYAAVVDQNGKSSDDYEGISPFDQDLFGGTDRWLELRKALAGAWTLVVSDAKDGVVTSFASVAVALILSNVVLFMVPMDEFCTPYPPKVRFTAFEHGGDFGLAFPHDWFGSDRPSRFDRLFDIATSGLLREGPSVEIQAEILALSTTAYDALGVQGLLAEYEPRGDSRDPVRNGFDADAVYEPTFVGGTTGVRSLFAGDLGRRRFASAISAQAALDPDWAPFVQAPGFRWFDPDAADQRLFSVAPALDYDVPMGVEGLSVSGELYGLLGTSTLLDQVRATVDADPGSARFPVPTLLLHNAQRGMVQFLDRQADRSNMDASLLATIDAHVPSPQVATAWTGPVLDFQPRVNDDLSISMTIHLGTRAFTVASPESISVGGVPSVIHIPFVESLGVRTRVVIPDDGTVLLGGLQNTGDSSVTPGVPLLSDIPVLDRLFSPSQKLGETRSLLLLVTPRIVKSGAYE